jgi:hypothetical protein
MYKIVDKPLHLRSGTDSLSEMFSAQNTKLWTESIQL